MNAMPFMDSGYPGCRCFAIGHRRGDHPKPPFRIAARLRSIKVAQLDAIQIPPVLERHEQFAGLRLPWRICRASGPTVAFLDVLP